MGTDSAHTHATVHDVHCHPTDDPELAFAELFDRRRRRRVERRGKEGENDDVTDDKDDIDDSQSRSIDEYASLSWADVRLGSISAMATRVEDQDWVREFGRWGQRKQNAGPVGGEDGVDRAPDAQIPGTDGCAGSGDALGEHAGDPTRMPEIMTCFGERQFSRPAFLKKRRPV